MESGPSHAKPREYSVTLEESGIDVGFQIFRRAGLYLATTVLAGFAAAALGVTALMTDVSWARRCV